MLIPLFRTIFVNHFHSPPPVYHSAIQASIGSYTSAHLLGNRMNVGDSALHFSSIPRLVLYPQSLSIPKDAGPQWSARTDGNCSLRTFSSTPHELCTFLGGQVRMFFCHVLVALGWLASCVSFCICVLSGIHSQLDEGCCATMGDALSTPSQYVTYRYGDIFWRIRSCGFIAVPHLRPPHYANPL